MNLRKPSLTNSRTAPRSTRAVLYTLVVTGILLTGGLPIPAVEARESAPVSSPFLYRFAVDGLLEETSGMPETSSPYWWVNSGAYVTLKNGRGYTNRGNLSSTNPWRRLYALSNPTDTDNGYHPQNIFRLLTRSTWHDARQQVYFKIFKDNVSESPNRNGSNGLLLFNRYEDGDNLYYTGVRVDGTAVIKKKKHGTYYTLAQEKIYPGEYDRDSNPNLLPKNSWIGLRSEVTNNTNGGVTIKVYLDPNWNNRWELVLEATDDGSSYGGSALTDAGYGGIRTDFMDIMFDHFEFRNI